MKEELGFRYAERKDTPLILAFIKLWQNMRKCWMRL